MIQSMTGYGKSTVVFRGKKINVEVKSLNSKARDLTMRVAPLYREKEIEIRSMIAHILERGKVDFCLYVEKDDTQSAAPINRTIFTNYYKQITDLANSMNLTLPSDWFSTILRMPDIMSKSEAEELKDEEWTVVSSAISEAVAHLVEFRKQEGAALEKKFTEKINNIETLLKDIEPYEKGRVDKIKARIIDGLKQLPEVDYDKNRMEQELIYYIEKLDISEEKQRLSNHLKYFRETLANGHGQGKKLGFIAQEMGREINTTGSKSNQAEMQNLVVKMKDELEQIKEQVLNVM